MAKSKEELLELKKEYESLCNKLKDLTEDELVAVSGGTYKKDIGADKNAKVIFTVEDKK